MTAASYPGGAARMLSLLVIVVAIPMSGCLADEGLTHVDGHEQIESCGPENFRWLERANWQFDSDHLAPQEGSRTVRIPDAVEAIKAEAYQDGTSVDGRWAVVVRDGHGREVFSASYSPQIQADIGSNAGGYTTKTWSPGSDASLQVDWKLEGFIENVAFRLTTAKCR